LAKLIFPGKLLVGGESGWRSLPVDNWAIGMLSGECYETTSRITRVFWFFSILAFFFLERALKSGERHDFKLEQVWQAVGQRKCD